MSIRKALLAGIAAADAPGATPTPTFTATPAAPTALEPTHTPAIRPQEWAVVTEEMTLHEAVIAGSRADVEESLDEGADVNATATGQFHTPMGLKVSGLTPLHLASALHDDPEVVALLLDRGADIKAKKDDGWTPLHLAAWSNDNPEVVALLLDRGADIEAKDDWGSTAQYLAAWSNPESTEGLRIEGVLKA